MGLDRKPPLLFIGARASVFVTRTAEFLTSQGFDLTIVDPWADASAAIGGLWPGKIGKIMGRWAYMRKSIALLPRDTVVIVHSISRNSFWLIPQLKRHFSRVVAIAYGSDVLRRVQSQDWMLRPGLKKLDAVAATNDNVLDCLVTDFPFLSRKEHKVVRFGLPVFPLLDRMSIPAAQARLKLDFDPEKPLISLGYSASAGQRQLELIGLFAQNPDQLQHVQFVVPVQYGDGAVVRGVERACDEANAAFGRKQFHALTSFQDVETTALMRRATTVLINHSVSDSFSGTVQEVVYAGGLVAAVEHLPYERMSGYGSAIKSYRALAEVIEMLKPEVLRAWQQKANDRFPENRMGLNATSSWSSVLPDWESLIFGDRA